MYLIDTNVISELRKPSCNAGVTAFFADAAPASLFMASISIGEIKRGAELARLRGEVRKFSELDTWLALLLADYAGKILPFDSEAAQIWGALRVPDPAHEIDKQIAAIALVHNLTVVTRNIADFARTSARLLNPFTAAPGPAI
jgi:predicted nucleic acid-binding protein